MPSGQMSHLYRPGECIYLTMCYIVKWVQVDRVQGYDEGQNSPGDPGFVKFCSMGPHHFGNPHNKLCHKHDKGEGDRSPGSA